MTRLTGVAIGQMGLGLEDFLNLTPFEFSEAHKAFHEKIKADREWDFNARMQVARWQVFRTLCPPEGKKISIFDLIELPGDNEIKAAEKERETTEDRYQKAKKRLGNKF